ncbi:unnamed protein product [Rangifer tarandus platyrhynchus]|uniref:Uncharacterized protein n=1 Tax=Rangifer tarandus platyrhynchus TaxID=3082113 RepID=A0ABN8XYT5_RANTA|nr:unnamed protein product [Rangifer tarandus platyrhynchus]
MCARGFGRPSCSAPGSAGQCLCGNPAITPTTPALPTSDGARELKPGTWGTWGGVGTAGRRKRLLTGQQQLSSGSSMQQGQGPWHIEVFALGGSCPGAQEGH